jgi:hypothetical protein
MSSSLSPSTRSDMKSAAGWIKFVGVCFIILAALFLIIGLMNASVGGGGGVGMLILLLLALGSALGAMGYLLILYSNNLSESAEQASLKPLDNGMSRLKSYFIIWGILTILGACVNLYQFTL